MCLNSSTNLDGRVGLGGVAALLSGDAARRSALALVPEPHPPLLRLLNDLYEGVPWAVTRREGEREPHFT